MTCWTAIAPLRFVRTLEDGTDPWNRSIGSYGHCESTSGSAGDSIPYLVVIATVNFTALVVANYQAYRARNIRTEFNESSYIAMANASFLQAIFIGLPIIFLTRENPPAYFIVVSVVLFILSGAILVFIFVPKIIALKERRKHQGRMKSAVMITGLSRGTLLGQSSSLSGADPVKSVLQQFQQLSWEDKSEVMKKLGATQPVPVHSSTEAPEWAGTSQPLKEVPEAPEIIDALVADEADPEKGRNSD